MADPAIQLKTLDALASAIGEITDLRRDLAERDACITKLGLMLDAAHEETRRAIASYDFERDCLTDRIAEREGLFREAACTNVGLGADPCNDCKGCKEAADLLGDQR